MIILDLLILCSVTILAWLFALHHNNWALEIIVAVIYGIIGALVRIISAKVILEFWGKGSILMLGVNLKIIIIALILGVLIIALIFKTSE